MAAEVKSGLRAVFDAVLRSYSQIFFSRSRIVGGVLLASTALELRMLIHGLLAVAVATLTARFLKVDDTLIEEGIYGYNALLVGLGTAALLADDVFAVGVLTAGSVLAVFLTAAARSATATSALPILTAPFLASYYLIVATTTSLGLSLALLPTGPALEFLPGWLELYLKSLGMIFFLPRLDVGLVLLAGMLIHSRIATLFSLAGVGVAYGVMQVSALSVLAGDVFPMLLSLNLIFSAIALGGVWFVPSRSSFLLGMIGAGTAAAMTISTAPILARFGLPILILPFNLTIWLMLFAMRQRVQDGAPKAVDFVPGTPEENYVYHRTHVSRFGAHYGTRLRAPFTGVWTCTQGVDGEHTHKGLWRHAFDFEVTGSDGEVYRGEGGRPTDYHCYNLPVHAPAAGSVVKVVNDVPDNAIGEPNLKENWGNLVLLYHAPGLYSLLCHLVPGSVVVHEGEWVSAGQVIGRCGNSGRSPVPHLHFQLQGVPRIGAPTIHTELHDVIALDGSSASLASTAVVRKGQKIRNIRIDESVANWFLAFAPGKEFSLETDGREERIEVAIDLHGRKVMKSDRGASLYFEVEDDRFIVFDVVGSHASGLHVLRACLGRVPFDDTECLAWMDHLPIGLVYSFAMKTAYEFVAPFIDSSGVPVEFESERQGPEFVIRGRSEREGGGRPLVSLEARFKGGVGLVECRMETSRKSVTVHVRGDDEAQSVAESREAARR